MNNWKIFSIFFSPLSRSGDTDEHPELQKILNDDFRRNILQPADITNYPVNYLMVMRPASAIDAMTETMDVLKTDLFMARLYRKLLIHDVFASFCLAV